MMFTRVAAFAVAALPLLAAATPLAVRGGEGSCSTGPIQCCNSVKEASDPATSVLLGLLGVVVQDITALIGLDCSPLSVVGVGSESCSSNVVCCQNNSVGGLISVGCIPVIA